MRAFFFWQESKAGVEDDGAASVRFGAVENLLSTLPKPRSNSRGTPDEGSRSRSNTNARRNPSSSSANPTAPRWVCWCGCMWLCGCMGGRAGGCVGEWVSGWAGGSREGKGFLQGVLLGLLFVGRYIECWLC